MFSKKGMAMKMMGKLVRDKTPTNLSDKTRNRFNIEGKYYLGKIT